MGALIGIVAAIAVLSLGWLLRLRLPAIAGAVGAAGFGLIVWTAVPLLQSQDWPALAAELTFLVVIPILMGLGLWVARTLGWPAWRGCLSMGIEPLPAILLANLGSTQQERMDLAHYSGPFDLWYDAAVGPFLIVYAVGLPLSIASVSRRLRRS